MIVGLRGNLEAVGPDWVHLQIGGVSLQVFVPSSAIGELGPIGGEVHLHTHLRIRDEQVLLYGFPTASALGLFSTLTGVSSVGPRLALAILSSLSVNNLLQAIANGDIAALSAAPGVGRRTAGRIILELKGKLDAGEDGASPVGAGDDAEVVEALTALGYSSLEARRALDRVQDASGLSVEERIRMALQQFGTGA